MKKIKISFIGVGFFSQISHLINYYENKDVELFEVCDFDLSLAKKIKKKFRFTGKACDNFKEMSFHKTDGIVVVVQRKLLSNIANFLIKKKCNFFTEKPHSYSSKDFMKKKSLLKKIWLKGYVRRWDPSIIKLKKILPKISKKMGKIHCINYVAKNGNSYLGKKHYIPPQLKIKRSGIEDNIYPPFLKKKNYKLYDTNLNSASHIFDLIEYFDIKDYKNMTSIINNDLFDTKFESYFLNQKCLVNLKLVNSKVNFWDETLEFLFQNGQIKIIFNPPLYKKNSHTIIVSLKNKKPQIISFKKIWSFKEQTRGFVKLIKNQVKNRKIYLDNGFFGIKCFEEVFKFYQKNSK